MPEKDPALRPQGVVRGSLKVFWAFLMVIF
jgi:hypothetical protein